MKVEFYSAVNRFLIFTHQSYRRQMATLRKNPSKDELSRYQYLKDLRGWLNVHEKPMGSKYNEDYENAQYYKTFMQSITSDRRPMDTASLILSTESLPSDVPVPITRVGGIVKQRLKEELAIQPELSCLAPAVILAQKRRKEVISKIQSGNWPLEYDQLSLIVQEDDVVEPAKSVSKFDHSSTTKPPPGNFAPKWEHYDTMKSRWRYLRPQTKQLATEIIAPTTSSNYLVSQGTQLCGKQVDINYYHSQSESKQMKNSKQFSSSRR
jgi:hypothetical protein